MPLDRRIDFLSLNYGVNFEVPFDVKVVLSTNLDPADLGDEAFFRRIQSKIFIGPITADAFDWILARVRTPWASAVMPTQPTTSEIVAVSETATCARICLWTCASFFGRLRSMKGSLPCWSA